MNRTTRTIIWVLFGGALVSAAVAVSLESELAALLSASCASIGVFLIFATPRASRPPLQATRPKPAANPRSVYMPTSSATMDVLELSKPVVFESSDSYMPEPLQEAAVPPPAPQPAQEVAAPASAPVYSFTPRLPAGSEPQEVVESLLVGAHAAGNPIAAHLWLEDPATDTLRLVAAVGPARPEAVPISLTGGLLGAALAEGTAHLGPIEATTPDTADLRRWRYALPLTGPELRGLAAIDFEDADEPDRAILTTLSATLRASLSGALALHIARVETKAARVLVETCTELARVLDPDDVLRTALDSAMSLSGGQTGSIMLVDPETRRMRIAVARGLPDEIVSATDISEGDGIAGWVVASRQPLVIEDLKNRGDRSRRHGVRSAVCVPLIDDMGVIGVLNVGCNAFHARFSRSHLDSLDALGRTVVVALRNAWKAGGAKDLYFDTLKALALALEARDPYARGGIARVVRLTDAIGAHFALSREDATALRIAAMLHDVGMSAAGTVAPTTEGPLSTVEWGMLKMHPVIAAEIMSQAPALASVIPIVYHHHEHFDGSGYVDGLSGDAIPLGSRILAVVDAYVAMTSGRPYRPALTSAQAIGELRRLSGSQFDPAVIGGLLEALGNGGRQGLLIS
jgi:HD-GYP domain-containing protein (c-di-GMP phosphodiesterase class II)